MKHAIVGLVTEVVNWAGDGATVAGPGQSHRLQDAVSARIILVDDHDGVRRSLGRALTAAGHAVQSFASAEEVLPLADAGIEADCLLIDVHLPGLSGIDLCRKLRARGVQLPVICMSSDHNDFLRTDALRSGAMAHLSKPFELEALMEVLDRALLCGRRA